MRRDSIFYHLFQQFPTLLFELVPNPPENASAYRFDSVAVKEPKFEIDGVFLPPESDRTGTVYFCEVQFQKDEFLYERLFGELFLYFYRNRKRFSDWQAVVVYPSQSTEQSQIAPYQMLLESDHVYRVYLDELGEIEQLPIGIALMVLTTIDPTSAVTAARELVARSQQEITDLRANKAIIDIIATIMVYKFDQMSRAEVEAMLNINLQKTRIYQEAKAEGRQEGQQEECRSLVLMLLNQRFGSLPKVLADRVITLNLDQLEALAVALLNFSDVEDLEVWLSQREQTP